MERTKDKWRRVMRRNEGVKSNEWRGNDEEKWKGTRRKELRGDNKKWKG